MGIDYAAVIIVGLPYDDIPNVDDYLDYDKDLLYDCPPYFDAYGCGIVGLYYKQSYDYKPKELEYVQEEVEALKQKFKYITGLEAKIWLSPLGR